MRQEKDRDRVVDLLRGLAIFAMPFGNAFHLLSVPPPFFFRLVSLAAPFFVILAGMMVGYSVHRHPDRGLPFFVGRGVFILCAGAVIDAVIWQIIPGTTVDILYLIGVAIPMAYLFLRLRPGLRWSAVILLFGAMPLLQRLLGYTDYPLEYNLDGTLATAVAHPTAIWKHWVIDGWFPLIPWAGFVLIGAALGVRRRAGERRGQQHWLAWGIGLLVVGGVLWSLAPGAQLVRAGYSELFYPPVLGFCATAVGFFLILFVVIRPLATRVFGDPLCCLGEAPLMLYLLHLTVIRYGFERVFKELALSRLLVASLLLALFLIAVGYGLRGVRRRWISRPLLARWCIG